MIAPDRRSAVAAFYAGHARRLECRIAAIVIDAPQATVEDACSYAWGQLLASDHVRLGTDGFAWLTTVAMREAWHQLKLDRRTFPVFDRRPETDQISMVPPEEIDIADVYERLEQLRSVERLPERERRALLMHAFGFSYEEIADATCDTVRTVDRHLRRARQRLREPLADQLGSREREVLAHLAVGDSVDTIAIQLGISRHTVLDHTRSIYRKLHVTTTSAVLTTPHS